MLKYQKTIQKNAMLVEDFMHDGFYHGDLSERKLARIIVDVLDDTDAIIRLISEIKKEKKDYLLDWYDGDEPQKRDEEINSLMNA